MVVDDLLTWGNDDDEHDAELKQLLDRAPEANLKITDKKRRIRQEEVPYIGHVLSKAGFKPDPEKIRAVQEMIPRTLKNLRHGFIQYLGKFMTWLHTTKRIPTE